MTHEPLGRIIGDLLVGHVVGDCPDVWEAIDRAKKELKEDESESAAREVARVNLGKNNQGQHNPSTVLTVRKLRDGFGFLLRGDDKDTDETFRMAFLRESRPFIAID
ncbi:MAG: hypothetical protein A3I39_00155 [Candidatus Yanofskybacteria bacterium RIFCSPLOWO2_02_FULL_47_9b]|uniref:Uncharacterized protein n=1 Tax=Candidatus Yanofskybacteria bacterium RIFCSPLOWO2_02_FULL_47_9b TaxID=1802708 RepID=A0A1F8HB57_9BACT|nr:MAG: hypothetical protein A3I39_00155 [Candidatus Yanofskybacteria bacterium RIFCSPLOWO2_02_FULL_47_9b]